MHGADHHSPDQKKGSPTRADAPVGPDHSQRQHGHRADLGDGQHEHDGRQDRSKRNSGNGKAYAAEDRLDQGGHHHTESDAANGLSGQPY